MGSHQPSSVNLGLPSAMLHACIGRNARVLDYLPRRVAGRRLIVGVQCLEKAYQRGGLRRRESTAIGGHVAAAEQHLANQLIFGQACGYIVESRAAHAAEAPDGVTVAALLFL